LFHLVPPRGQTGGPKRYFIDLSVRLPALGPFVRPS